LTGVRYTRPDVRPVWTTTPKPGAWGASGRVSRFVTRSLKRAILLESGILSRA
jgi:hypothetical protein